MLSGVPIEGEAGVGYTLRHGFDLPSLMFREGELEALVFGARVVARWGATLNLPGPPVMPLPGWRWRCQSACEQSSSRLRCSRRASTFRR